MTHKSIYVSCECNDDLNLVEEAAKVACLLALILLPYLAYALFY